MSERVEKGIESPFAETERLDPTPKPTTDKPRRNRLGGPLFGLGWSGQRCGARTRHGSPCQCPALEGKRRCRLHGGLSTGPKTPEGKERSRRAGLKHGRRTREVMAAQRQARALIREAKMLMRVLFGIT
jgi:hypothetical protein